jgi:3-keto-disaccharide hydrolase
MRSAALLALTLILALPRAAFGQEWESLFNGKDLTGWKGKPDLWSVKDGAITGYTKDGRIPGGNSFLVWDGTLKDFELKAKFKITGGNSGIQYRSRAVDKPDDFHIAGYQADIDGAKGMGFFGICYEERGRGIICNRGTKTFIDADGSRHEQRIADGAEVLRSIKANDWNEYHIMACANHLTQKINGATTAEVIDWQTDKRTMEGLLAFQIHAGMGEMTVQFKDVQLKKLTDCKEVTKEAMPIPADAKKIEPPKPKAKK